MKTKDWASHKDVMEELFLIQRNKLQDVMEAMRRDHNFHASKAQYERRFRDWGFRKNKKGDEWKAIGHKIKKRDREGRESNVYNNGVLIDQKRLRKEISRYCLPSIQLQNEAHISRIGGEICIQTPPSLPAMSYLLRQLPLLDYFSHMRSKVNMYPYLATAASQLDNLYESFANLTICRETNKPENCNTQDCLVSHLSLTSDATCLLCETSHTQQTHNILRAMLPEDIDLLLAGGEDTAGLIKLNESALYLSLAIYMISNNFLDFNVIKNTIRRLENQVNGRVLASILSTRKPTVQAFAENLFRAAVKSGSIEIVKATINAGVSFNIGFGPHESNALVLAAAAGNIELVQLLTTAGADVNGPPIDFRGRTALQAAAETGNIVLVQLLLAAGADVNAPPSDYEGMTVLQAAAATGNIELVQLLLAAGADVNGPLSDSRGRTALQAAAGTGNIELVQLLLAAGADVNGPPSKYHGRTALQAAAGTGNVELVQLLLAAGADVNGPPSMFQGRTALQIATENNSISLVELLLSAGADVNSLLAEWFGFTALQGAAIKGTIGIAMKLLEAGADVNAPRSRRHGRSALEGAVEHGRIDMVRLLLNAGADCGGPGTPEYRRLLKLAWKEGHIAIYNFVKAHFEDVEDTIEVGGWVTDESGSEWCYSGSDEEGSDWEDGGGSEEDDDLNSNEGGLVTWEDWRGDISWLTRMEWD